MPEPVPNGLDARIDAGRLLQVSGDADRLDKLSLLPCCKKRHKRFEVAVVGCLKGIDVFGSFTITHDRRQPIGLDEYQRDKRSGDTSIPVLERVDLSESVMKPCCFDFWRTIIVTAVKIDQTIHLGGDMFGRTVLVDRAVGARRIVWQFLVVASDQWHLVLWPN